MESRTGYDVRAASEASFLQADFVAVTMSFAISSVFVPSVASMSPPIAAVFVSSAGPPVCLEFWRPLERFLPTMSRLC